MITTITFSATITFNFDKEEAKLSINPITPYANANYFMIQKYLQKYMKAELKSRTSPYKRFLRNLIKLLERMAE